MKPDQQLPEDFDGVFRFTNFSDEDFVAKWNSVEYTFPAMKTTPMLIPEASQFEIQSIRKKFARELATREWYKTDKFKGMDSVGKADGKTPATYTESDLAPFIQKCLEALPIARATTKKLPKDSEDNYTKDEEGNNRTRVLKDKESLTKGGSALVA